MLSNFKVNRIHVRIVDAVIGKNYHVETVLSFCDINAISMFTRTFIRTIIAYHLHLKKRSRFATYDLKLTYAEVDVLAAKVQQLQYVSSSRFVHPASRDVLAFCGVVSETSSKSQLVT